jgi:hypothetical protein
MRRWDKCVAEEVAVGDIVWDERRAPHECVVRRVYKGRDRIILYFGHERSPLRVPTRWWVYVAEHDNG